MLTPPSKGAPLDLEFIGQVATAITDLQKTTSGLKATTIAQIGPTSKSIPGPIAFYANSTSVSIQDPKVGQTQSVVFQFNSGAGVNFKLAPFIATSVYNDAGGAGNRVTAVVTKSNSTGCTVDVVYNEAASGSVKVTITVLAIGWAQN